MPNFGSALFFVLISLGLIKAWPII
uniref:Uncharacterized protein n=1 Tax=Anguilla anguilla TaxID=7936 RepID=A0A0E9V6F7_ANGAN